MSYLRLGTSGGGIGRSGSLGKAGVGLEGGGPGGGKEGGENAGGSEGREGGENGGGSQGREGGENGGGPKVGRREVGSEISVLIGINGGWV